MASSTQGMTGKSVGTVLLCVTEDWFALSHFQPLIEVLVELSSRVVVVSNVKDGEDRLRALGADVRAFDFSRASLSPLQQVSVVRRLAKVLGEERPDVVHFISLQTMVAGALALALPGTRSVRTVFHLTGAGFLVTGGGLAGRVLKPGVFALLRSRLARPGNMLFVENSDDLALVSGGRAVLERRVAIIPGAGVDPDSFPPLGETGNDPPVVAFVGRMLRSKGVFVLAEAGRLLAEKGIAVEIRLFGPTDDNPDSVSVSELEVWQGGAGTPNWQGRTDDVAGVWRDADICVMAPLVREGMPRAMLEAAASGRPLIVSDVPGCRHFVTHELEGLIVPPGDAVALAAAIERLVTSHEDALRFGRNAREKLVREYSTAAVKVAIAKAYKRMRAD